MKKTVSEKITAWAKRKIKDLEDEILNFWLWKTRIEKGTGFARTYARQYAEDIMMDIAQKTLTIKEIITDLQENIADNNIKTKLSKAMATIETELFHIDYFWKKVAQKRR